ncbi:MAG: hypothetical protein ACRC9Y_09980 [Aeromonas veronii]
MAKMNKEQTTKFNKLFETTINWGDGENCVGLFEEFGGINDKLATCVDGDSIEILNFDGCYYQLMTHIPAKPKAKAKEALKKVVTHLMDGKWKGLDV